MGTKKVRLLESKKNKNASFSQSLPSADLIERTLKRKKKHHSSRKSEIDDVNKEGELYVMEEVKAQGTMTDVTASSVNESHKTERKKKKCHTSNKIKSEKSQDVCKGGKQSSTEGEVKTQVALGESTETSSVNEVNRVSRKRKKSPSSNAKLKFDKSIDEVNVNKSMEDDHPKGEQSEKCHSGVEETAKAANKELVDEIHVVDTDCSRGMKKWLNQYWSRRPGLKILQDNIDQFLVAHEAAEEKARKEREALAAEGGWTVVVHHKGRKKTTDAETGVSVSSVAQAAVMENQANKKRKEIPLDFYRFQKREARRNEVMQLQSKFEQEKKRIQQLRAARKFRPY